MKEISSQHLEQAIAVLKRGGVVVFPTETSYGLAADATNPEATKRVCEIKERIEEKVLPVIAADLEMVELFAGLTVKLKVLADKHWPGALTLILPTLDTGLAPGVMKNGEVAVRVSSHPVAQALSSGLGKPIVSTSANKTGASACYSVACVREQLGDEPDLYLDSGVLEPRLPSTIVTVDDYGYPEVLRQGEIEL